MTRSERSSTIARFGDLLKASESLRKALVARDVEAIWAAVNSQEKIVGFCTKAYEARSGERAEAGGDDAQPVSAKETELVDGLRRLQRTNRRVAGGFLEAVDRTLSSLGASAPRRQVTYGVGGWCRTPSVPVLIYQRG